MSVRGALPPLDDAEAVIRALGWQPPVSICPLPGHHLGPRGDYGRACLDLDPRGDGDLTFICDCFGKSADWDYRGLWRSEYWRPLSDVYWSIRTGNVLWPKKRLSATARFQWRLLLSYRMGLIEPVDVKLPDLGDDVIERDRRAAHFWALWWGLRRAVEPDLQESAFSARFVEEACPLPNRAQAGLAIKALGQLGVTEMVREDEPVGKRKNGTRFYRPVRAS